MRIKKLNEVIFKNGYEYRVVERDEKRCESFPSNEEFGKRAWTYKSLTKAQEKYRSLECHEDMPQAV